MFNYIRTNLKALAKYYIYYCAAIFSVFEAVTIFISFEDFSTVTKKGRIIIFVSILLIVLVLSFFTVIFKSHKQFFGDINKGLTICYGDIIKLKFENNNNESKIIVIPVNRCFDFCCQNNLIDPTSIHGQWINEYIYDDSVKKDLDKTIEQSLLNQNVQFELLTKQEKPSGKLKRYPEGTIVEIPYKNGIKFYLLAVAKLDNNLKAHCTETEFYNAISNLIKYHDSHDLGKSLYCPIIGDHIINPSRSTPEIIKFMVSTFCFNKNYIRSKIHIVVYNKMKSDISILDY